MWTFEEYSVFVGLWILQISVKFSDFVKLFSTLVEPEALNGSGEDRSRKVSRTQLKSPPAIKLVVIELDTSCKTPRKKPGLSNFGAYKLSKVM